MKFFWAQFKGTRHPRLLIPFLGVVDVISAPGKSLPTFRPVISFRRHQKFIRTTQSQLNPEDGGDQQVDFPGLNFLQVARGNFGAFGQFILGQFLAHALPADVCAEDLYSLPFFC